ncbi:MAG: hemagglutinin repeat-containing protein [Campylobacteraceae bacterium]|nr:hemagglutinin repeat-containing protein [Campylobacteraceae bacterium]
MLKISTGWLIPFKQFISAFIAFTLTLNPYIFASGITPDQSLPNNAPSIQTASNGRTPIINIVKPNKQGLSHNKFQDYNVDKQGVILNNSKETVNTKLANSISGNPNFEADSAKVILNEVTGTKKSNLLGFTEVAGDKADVIVANPNGIYVNGGGFINVNAATLTTGELKFQDGLLNGFSVNRGDIAIDGFGLDANNIDRVNLYSKTLILNAKLHANNLNVILGDNDININGSFIQKQTLGSGLSLDSSSLGGIYANTIYLTSSDKGVGVNLPPEILSADSITLNVNGDLRVDTSGVIVSGGDINITADDNINLLNTDIAADKDVNILSSKDITIGSTEEKDEFDSGYSIINHGSSINGSNINIGASNILINASNLKAYDTISFDAKNSADILAKNNTVYTESQVIDSSGFLSKETTTQTSYHENTVSSTLEADNIFINSGSDVTLEAAKLTANNNIYIDAKENINIIAKVKKDTDSYTHSKSSWGGLKKSSDFDESEVYTLSPSDIKTINNGIVFNSKKDINIIASNINSAGDLQFEAFDNVLIAAGNEKLTIKKTDKNSYLNPLNIVGSLFTSGSIYKSDATEDTIDSITAKSSNLNSGNNIIIKSRQADIAGSNLEAQNDIAIKTDTKHIDISTAQTSKDILRKNKRVDLKLVNIKDMAKDIVKSVKEDENLEVKVTISASFDESLLSSLQTNHTSSNLKSNNGNIVLDSFDDIRLSGSNLKADKGRAALNSNTGSINIQEAINTKEDEEKTKHAKVDISFIAQNEYIDAVLAAKSAFLSAKQLKEVKGSYSKYKSEIKKLESTLADIKQRYSNNEVGITKEDIENLEKIIDNIKDEEKHYVTAIAAASADLTTKAISITSQTASAVASSATYGFNIGAALDLSGQEVKTDTKTTDSINSNIKAKDILLTTSISDDLKLTSIAISGSNLEADNSINIQTENLDISSSVNTLTKNQSVKELSGSISATGIEIGVGALVNYSESYLDANHTYNVNSNFLSDNINIYVKNDANIKGGTLRAENTFDAYAGNNLNLESVKDSYSSSLGNTSYGYGLSTSVIGIVSGITGYDMPNNTKSENYQEKKVVTSSITGGNISINVEGNTNLKGSLIAAGNFEEEGDFMDNGQLDFSTKTLNYSSLQNEYYFDSKSLNESLTYIFNGGLGSYIAKTVSASIQKFDLSYIKNLFANSDETDSETFFQSLNSIKYYNDKIKNIIDKARDDLGYTKESDAWNYSNAISHSSENILATVGQGSLVIKDTKNSDEFEKLNRDTSNINKPLYASSVGLEVKSIAKVGISSDIKKIVTGAYGISAVIENVISINIFDTIKGDGVLNTVGNIGYFISNLKYLKELPVAVKSGDIPQINDIFEQIMAQK